MRAIDRINSGIHSLMIRRVLRHYNKKMDDIFRRRPDLAKPVDPEITRKHLELYGRLGLPCNDKWLRLFCNVSGIVDHRYVGEDLFFARIERVLNDCNRSSGEAEDKNEYSLFIDPKYQPRFVLRFIRGSFFDEGYGFVSDAEAAKILSSDNGDLIGKVAVASLGGKSISKYVFSNGEYRDKGGSRLTVDFIRANFQSYVIQEKVRQCDFSAQFNPHSANTCRVNTLRCPWDGKTVVVKAGMRFGSGNDVYDNLSSGGMCVSVNAKGELSRYAHNWYKLDAWTRHPLTDVEFGGQVHPFFGKMCEVACKYAAIMPNFNLLSWDFLADENGDVRILEINETSQSHDWQQYDFGPFFGEYTEKVIDWCATHLRYDRFVHLRTWYA